MADSTFHWADYLVFGLSLALSLGIGVFFSFKQTTVAEFHTGGRHIHFIPVALSLLASTLNAVFIIGGPAEIYYFGPVYSLVVVAWIFTAIIVTVFFLPTFHNFKITSAYEYLEKRYTSQVLRMAASAIFSLAVVLFLSVVIYTPAFAFAEVTKFPLEASIVVCGVVCTIYTCIGGMRAVVWTDAVQMIIIVVGLFTLLVKGIISHDGDSSVMDIVKDGNRFNWDILSIDPRARHTVWTQTIGNTVIWTAFFGSNQMAIQRYLSIKSVNRAAGALVGAIIVATVILMMVVGLAFVMYAHYRDCDPVFGRQISRGDQLVPYFLMDMLGDLHGLPGLFSAAVFAAALSSVSSALNSLSAVILEDFIKPIRHRLELGELGERSAIWTSKILVLIFGGITIGLSFAAQHMGEQIIEVPTTIWGVTAPPLLGIFIMGFFLPFTTATQRDFTIYIYDISYVWIALIGLVVCLLVGSLASLMDTALCGENDLPDPDYMHKWVGDYVRKRQPSYTVAVDSKGKSVNTEIDNKAFELNKI